MIKLTNEIWKQIEDVNAVVNNEITYAKDSANYGKGEYWNRPENGKGDCEDYALEKQARLKELGIPSFIGRCWTDYPDGAHAVLLVDTDRGTFVLDNRYEAVWSYDKLDYKWRMRQTEGDVWREIVS